MVFAEQPLGLPGSAYIRPSVPGAFLQTAMYFMKLTNYSKFFAHFLCNALLTNWLELGSSNFAIIFLLSRALSIKTDI